MGTLIITNPSTIFADAFSSGIRFSISLQTIPVDSSGFNFFKIA